MDFQTDNQSGFAVIKVLGCGGAGCNAINRMIESKLQGVEFIAVNTDCQALALSNADTRIQIGEKKTKGLGAGAVPEIGKQAAEESREELAAAIRGADLLFITAGMGGGTGTGAAPIVAEIARDSGCLSVAVVTKPFVFEGKLRMRNAETGIKELKQRVDTLVIVPNESLLKAASPGTTILEAFSMADDVLRQGIQGISDLIALPSLINLDFADIRAVMEAGGIAHMGIGIGSGENKMLDAVQNAVKSPLLDTDIKGARSVLINITGGADMSISETSEAAQMVTQEADPEANIIFGAGIDESLKDEIHITVIATGFEKSPIRAKELGNRESKRFNRYGTSYASQYTPHGVSNYEDDDDSDDDDDILDEVPGLFNAGMNNPGYINPAMQQQMYMQQPYYNQNMQMPVQGENASHNSEMNNPNMAQEQAPNFDKNNDTDIPPYLRNFPRKN